VAAITEQLARQVLEARYGDCELFTFEDRWQPSQRNVLSCELPFVFLTGGNGSGKSTVGGRWMAAHCEGVNPTTGKLFHRRQPPNFYIAGTTDEKTEGTLWPSVQRFLPRDAIVREDKTNGIVYLRGGARLFKKSMKQGRRAFESDEVDAIWLDEEPEDREVWDECLARMFRRLGQMLVTMTTAEGTVWLHQWMYSEDEFPMDQKGIFRIPVYDNPYYYDCDRCGHPQRYHAEFAGIGCAKRRCACRAFSNAKGTLKLDRIKRMYHGLEYEIRVEGRHLLRAGHAVISPDIQEARKKEYETTPKYGLLKGGRFQQVSDAMDPRVYLRVQKLPEVGHQYVVGVDVGGGNPLGDYHAAFIVDAEDGEQVALVHTRAQDVRDFGTTMFEVASFYNEAFVVPEINNHGLACVNRMIDLGYVNIYRRRVIDATRAEAQDKIGFLTEKRSKVEAVDLMVDFFTNRLKARDPLVYAELLSYVYLREPREGSHGIGNANSEGHDDVVTAMWLACKGLAELGWCRINAAPPPEPEQQRHPTELMSEQFEKDAVSSREAPQYDDFGEQVIDEMDEGVTGW
jgi:phage terminase large subunit-like protein